MQRPHAAPQQPRLSAPYTATGGQGLGSPSASGYQGSKHSLIPSEVLQGRKGQGKGQEKGRTAAPGLYEHRAQHCGTRGHKCSTL